MSFYAYDSGGYIGDFASNTGWFDFADWARRQGDALKELADNGAVTDLASLRKQVVDLEADDESDQSVLDNLKVLAGKAKDVFIVSDGEVTDE